jgi:hypothetical protein
MGASSSERQEIVDTLATQWHKPDYTTALDASGSLLLLGNPDVTLKEFFQGAEG